MTPWGINKVSSIILELKITKVCSDTYSTNQPTRWNPSDGLPSFQQTVGAFLLAIWHCLSTVSCRIFPLYQHTISHMFPHVQLNTANTIAFKVNYTMLVLYQSHQNMSLANMHNLMFNMYNVWKLLYIWDEEDFVSLQQDFYTTVLRKFSIKCVTCITILSCCMFTWELTINWLSGITDERDVH